MCGRFALETDLEAIYEQFGIKDTITLPASYNIAPTEQALCVKKAEGGLIALTMKWGITPWYSRGKARPKLLINARAESIASKPTFRQSLKYRRCLLIMSGFFEWQDQSKNLKIKQPYYFKREDNKLMAVAAVYDNERMTDGKVISSCCLLTTEANETVGKLHDRMPWLLTENQQKQWLLDQVFDEHSLKKMIKERGNIPLSLYPVTPNVNSALYKESDCISSIDGTTP
ncbi:SOS response-associated peptidase [Legionella jordanis]|uniref:SOS response-associated peptidase n=1 Tax=Legionella jordanis TaxID=456 RepID=UPI000EFF4789|nr:SOS response-associated peptidase [Legionella jordanis]RMX20974.1 SOS response-associated peptidase [Legionella jordanis]